MKEQESAKNPIVSFKRVDIVFGKTPTRALPLIDAGRTRREIMEETGQLAAVSGATFDLFEGELLVLMGLSGSGKSTLLRAVNGLIAVTRGELLFHNGSGYIHLEKCSKKELLSLRRRRVAMVFQQFGLFPWRTVSDNVGFGLEIAGMAAALRREKVEAKLDLVGLSNWGKKYLGELSGGMQQRVALARALVTEAPLLLMDEPFSSLDPLIRCKLQEELLDLQKKLNRTILFVSHDLDEAAKIGSRIAIIKGGRVVQIATPQEIVKNPADEYVAQFVTHMNPLNVLRASDIMASPGGAAERSANGESCSPDTPIREVAKRVREKGRPIVVVKEGVAVGLIGERELLSCIR